MLTTMFRVAKGSVEYNPERHKTANEIFEVFLKKDNNSKTVALCDTLTKAKEVLRAQMPYTILYGQNLANASFFYIEAGEYCQNEGSYEFVKGCDIYDLLMEEIVVEGNATRTFITAGDCRFEVVNTFPLGYKIWNIGEPPLEGYLPLARLKAIQPFEGCTEIEPDTLKIIATEGAREILLAVRGGVNSVEKMEDFLEKTKGVRPDSWLYVQRGRIEKALPYLRKIMK